MHPQSEKSNPPGNRARCCAAKRNTIAGWLGQWSARRFALHVAVIIVGAGLYGAAMGWWRDPQQALFTAIKFPLIILLTTLGNALINGMLAPLLGLNIPFRQSFSAILMSFTIAAAILGAFSPVLAFMIWNAPPISPETVQGATYSSSNSPTSPSSRLRARRATRGCFNCSRGSAAAGPSRFACWWPGWR